MRARLLILACVAACGNVDAPADVAPVDVAVVSRVHPGSPVEAVDLDPDPRVLHVRLRAAPLTRTIDGVAVPGYAYNGETPGPTLRAKVGDTLVAELDNALDVPTTIHWHGARVPYAMDGVQWKTSPIAPGAQFTYTFVLDRAGTYWYHPHFDSAEQVDRGLYGLLVVEDPADPPADELDLVFDLWNEETGLEDGGGEDHGLVAALGRWVVNGLMAPTYRLSGGRSVRVRLLNASNVGYLDLRGPELRQIASDQGLLAEPETPDRLVLSPGDRAELEWRIGTDGFALTTAPYTVNGGSVPGEGAEVLRVEVDDPAPEPEPLDWAFSHATPTPDPGSTDVLYTFSGSSEGGSWLINGETYPDVTVAELPFGQPAIVEVRNLSPAEHPFHLHGMAFEVLSVSGAAPAAQQIEDTVNVAIGQAVRLLVVADNPGDWMAHCHILPHAHDGMMTVLRVLPERR